MDLSCAFPPGPALVGHVKLAEELGYRRAWVFDSPGLYGDCWMHLARCADATSSIGLGPAVLVPSLRHVATNAAAVASLEQLAPGRVAVAVGTGFTGRFMLGQPPLTWAATGEYVAQLAGLMRGETVDVEGRPVRLVHPEGWTAPRPLPTPLLVAANGPRGLAVAQEVGADGVMSIFGAQSGWDWSALFGYGTVLEEGEPLDSPRVLDAAGPGAAVVFHGMYEADPALLDALPGGATWREAIEAFPADERHLHTHELHFVGMSERDRAAVTGELIGSTTWTGTAEALSERLETVAREGVTEFLYTPMGPDIPRELREFRALVA